MGPRLELNRNMNIYCSPVELPRFVIPPANRVRQEKEPFRNYAKILNDLSDDDDEWDELGLPDINLWSTKSNTQLEL